MNQKVLFLEYSNKDFFAQQMSKRGITVEPYLKNYHATVKIFRILPILVINPIIHFFFGNWKYNLNSFDVIIIPASYYAPKIIRYVKRKRKDIRIIVWYWNSVKFDYDPKHFKQLDCELWSFDEDDCKQYSMNYNSQYYFNDIQIQDNTPEIDVLFIGRDKGRLGSLLKLENEFKSKGLKSYFHITETIKKDNTKGYIFKEEMDYTDVLKYISKSKVLLDYTQEDQIGLTLRPLEAVFFNKKLITNNKSIMNHHIYDSNNVYVLGVDKYDLKKFVDTNFDKNQKKLIEYYDFNQWLLRFNIN